MSKPPTLSIKEMLYAVNHKEIASVYRVESAMCDSVLRVIDANSLDLSSSAGLCKHSRRFKRRDGEDII